MTARSDRKIDLDKVGAFASAACAVHCVLTGLALGVISVLGFGFLDYPIVEWGFFGTAVFVGAWAVIHGIRRHHSLQPSLVFSAGMLCLILSHFVVGHATVPGALLSALGGCCLVGFHLLNHRLGHRCGECNCPAPVSTDLESA